MHRKYAFLFTALVLTLLLVSCGGGNQPEYCDPATLASPILFFPYDGGQYIPWQTLMTWFYPDPTCNPEGYRIEVDTVSDFSGNVLGATTTYPNSTAWPLPVEEGVTYYWRVRAMVGSVEGPWSTTKTFHGVLPCGLSSLVAPVLLGPSEGRTVAFEDPYFSWDYPDPSCAPESYHVQISADSTFTTATVDELTTGPPFQWRPTNALADCTVYYWRVAGTEGGVDGPFSEVWSFYFSVHSLCPTPACTPTGLIPPEAIGPGGYEIVGSLTPTFEWDYPTYCDPEGFVIRVGPDHDLSSQPLQGGFGLTGSWTPSVPLEIATQYWWDVAAIVPPALGPFSNDNTFFTGPECSFGDTLGPPELISPPNGAEIHETYAWLQFNAGASVGCIPDGYAADLQTDPNFGGTNLLQTYMFPANNIITEPLQDCTEHFWRIAAVQNSIAGPWSVTGSFFTNAAGNCAISMIREIPYAVAIRDLACYRGPEPEVYPIEGYLLAGETSPILAQNLPQTWWVIQNPDGLPDDQCYVPKDGVDAFGDLSAISLWNDPLVPTEGGGRITCITYDDQTSCADAGCYWWSDPEAPLVYRPTCNDEPYTP